MTDLIKKNLMLTIVLAVALVLSLALLFLVSRKHRDMKQSLADVEKLRDEINELNLKRPAPLQENIDRLQADCRLIRERATELQSRFGKRYYEAVTDFAKELGHASVAELKEKWQAHQKKDPAKGVRLTQVFTNFLNGYDRATVEKALLTFKRLAEMRSVEELTEANLLDVVLEALGHPRTMSPEACKTYITQMQGAVGQLLQPMRPQEGEHVVVLNAGVEKFTFGDYEQRMPLPSDVSYIVKNWKMLEDLAFRLKEARVGQLVAINRQGTLKGREENGYLYLTYDIEVETSQDSLRELLNRMQQAYEDHCLYIVRDLELTKVADEVDTALNPKEPAKTQPGTGPRPPPRQPGGMPPMMMGPGGAAEEESASGENADDGYGRVLIGRNRDVRAKLVFDYVIYVGDESQGG